MTAACDAEPGPQRLLSRLQRQRDDREPRDRGAARRAARSRPTSRSSSSTTAAPIATADDRRRARAHRTRKCASSTTSATAATAARCAAASPRATKELIFYTDGDAQYDPSEMAVLWQRARRRRRSGERLQDQPVRSAAPHRHRPDLPPHGEAAVRPDGARRRLRLPADAPLDLRHACASRRTAASSASR